MSIDVIKSIKQAEAEAEEVIKKSTEDSRQILLMHPINLKVFLKNP